MSVQFYGLVEDEYCDTIYPWIMDEPDKIKVNAENGTYLVVPGECGLLSIYQENCEKLIFDTSATASQLFPITPLSRDQDVGARSKYFSQPSSLLKKISTSVNYKSTAATINQNTILHITIDNNDVIYIVYKTYKGKVGLKIYAIIIFEENENDNPFATNEPNNVYLNTKLALDLKKEIDFEVMNFQQLSPNFNQLLTMTVDRFFKHIVLGFPRGQFLLLKSSYQHGNTTFRSKTESTYNYTPYLYTIESQATDIIHIDFCRPNKKNEHDKLSNAPIGMFVATTIKLYHLSINVPQFHIITKEIIDTFVDEPLQNNTTSSRLAYLPKSNRFIIVRNGFINFYDSQYGKLSTIELPVYDKLAYLSSNDETMVVEAGENKLSTIRSLFIYSIPDNLCVFQHSISIPTNDDVIVLKLDRAYLLYSASNSFTGPTYNHIVIKEFTLEKKMYTLVANNQFELAKKILIESLTKSLLMSMNDIYNNVTYRTLNKLHADYLFSIHRECEACDVYLQCPSDLSSIEIIQKFEPHLELLIKLLESKYQLTQHDSSKVSDANDSLLEFLLVALIKHNQIQKAVDYMVDITQIRIQQENNYKVELKMTELLSRLEDINNNSINNQFILTEQNHLVSMKKMILISALNFKISLLESRLFKYKTLNDTKVGLILENYIPFILNKTSFEESADLLLLMEMPQNKPASLSMIYELKNQLNKLGVVFHFIRKILSYGLSKEFDYNWVSVWNFILRFINSADQLIKVVIEFGHLLFQQRFNLDLENDSGNVVLMDYYTILEDCKDLPELDILMISPFDDRGSTTNSYCYFKSLDIRLYQFLADLLDYFVTIYYHDLQSIVVICDALTIYHREAVLYFLNGILAVTNSNDYPSTLTLTINDKEKYDDLILSKYINHSTSLPQLINLSTFLLLRPINSTILIQYLQALTGLLLSSKKSEIDRQAIKNILCNIIDLTKRNPSIYSSTKVESIVQCIINLAYSSLNNIHLLNCQNDGLMIKLFNSELLSYSNIIHSLSLLKKHSSVDLVKEDLYTLILSYTKTHYLDYYDNINHLITSVSTTNNDIYKVQGISPAIIAPDDVDLRPHFEQQVTYYDQKLKCEICSHPVVSKSDLESGNVFSSNLCIVLNDNSILHKRCYDWDSPNITAYESIIVEEKKCELNQNNKTYYLNAKFITNLKHQLSLVGINDSAS